MYVTSYISPLVSFVQTFAILNFLCTNKILILIPDLVCGGSS